MSWIILTQILLCLVGGGLIARYFSEPIRSLVVRTMPLEKRISEDSFHIQARASTIIAATLALLLAGALFWGAEHIKSWSGLPPSFKQQQQSLITDLGEMPNLTPSPVLADSGWVEDPMITQALPKPTVEYTTDSVEPTPAPILDLYYLQVGAFDNVTNANSKAEALRQQHGNLVQQLHLGGSIGPEKVLLGPFPTREAASTYRQRHRLKAWVRQQKR